MSSSDCGTSVSSRNRVAACARALLLAGSVAAVSACTIQPVYMPVKQTHFVAADLSAIAVDGAGDRVSQEVRNNLVFAFTGGRNAPPPRYTLSMRVSNSEQRLGFEKDETAPAYQVTIAVNYELKDIASGRSIVRTNSSGVATYDRSNQNFANVRARIDAEDRAAQAVADEIQLRLAIALAKDVPPAAKPAAAAIAPTAASTTSPAKPG